MNLFLKKFLLFFLSFFTLLSCSKKSLDTPNQPTGVSNNNTISSFVFKSSNNSNANLKSDIFGIISHEYNIIYITVPEEVDITNLIPNISIDSKATFVINNSSYDGKIPLDFSKVHNVKVTAENGNSKIYNILGKNGNVSLDKKIYQFMLEYNIPGLSTSCSNDGKIKYSYGYGWANKEKQERVTNKHLFRLASVSKHQTASAIMMLHERGLLKLDDKIFGTNGILNTEFPDVSDHAMNVTVRSCLEHNTGWTNDPDPMFTSDSRFSGKSAQERIAVVVKTVPKTTNVGEKYSYYNLGYTILGEVIAKVSGKTYEKFLKEDLHPAAGVTDIMVSSTYQDTKNTNECVFYGQDGYNAYNNDMSVIAACGGLTATPDALVNFVSGIDYYPNTPDFFKKETLDLMYTPSKCYNNYGLGWRLNHSTLSNWGSYHGGNINGTATILVRGKNGVNCAVLCNSRSYTSGFDTALYLLADDIINITGTKGNTLIPWNFNNLPTIYIGEE